MDRYGHINNVMIQKYVQTARVHFWEETGIGSGIREDGTGANLAAVNCKFLLPVLHPETIEINTSVFFIKNSSFGLRHLLYSAKGELLAEAEDIVVFFNYHKQKKTEITAEIRAQLELFM